MSAAIFMRQRRKADMKISSGLKTLFLVHFIFGLGFGLVNLLIPAMYMGWSGIQVQDQFPWRIVGAAILAFTVSSWYCYKAAEWDKVKIVVIAEIVWTSLVALVGLYGLLFAGQPAGFWVNVIIMAGFAIAFAYFYAIK
jgi:hypothetical protein